MFVSDKARNKVLPENSIDIYYSDEVFGNIKQQFPMNTISILNLNINNIKKNVQQLSSLISIKNQNITNNNYNVCFGLCPKQSSRRELHGSLYNAPEETAEISTNHINHFSSNIKNTHKTIIEPPMAKSSLYLQSPTNYNQDINSLLNKYKSNEDYDYMENKLKKLLSSYSLEE